MSKMFWRIHEFIFSSPIGIFVTSNLVTAALIACFFKSQLLLGFLLVFNYFTVLFFGKLLKYGGLKSMVYRHKVKDGICIYCDLPMDDWGKGIPCSRAKTIDLR
ncbi:MAG: hypothetical protein AAB847_01550 [Patescibacteria group bacterium]